MNELKQLLPQGTLKQWAYMTALFLVGFTGFVMMAGEDDMNNPMLFLKWLVIKVIGLALFCACFKIGQVLGRKGLLPECKEDEEDWYE